MVPSHFAKASTLHLGTFKVKGEGKTYIVFLSFLLSTVGLVEAVPSHFAKASTPEAIARKILRNIASSF